MEEHNQQPMTISEKIWSGFCKQIKKIFPKNMCIYPSEMDIESLKKIQKNKNIDFSNGLNNPEDDDDVTPIEILTDIMRRNFFFLCKPTNWNFSVNRDGKIQFTPLEVSTEFEKFIKNKQLNDVLELLEKCKSLRDEISDPNDKIETKKNLDRRFILENLDDPRVLAMELNKIKTFLQNSEATLSQDANEKNDDPRYLKVAKQLYEILKKIEYQAKLFKGALGDNEEDNDYIIERERTGGFIWKILRWIGIGGDHYQEISDKNGSKEFNLNELFKRSKIYRRMIRAYLDFGDKKLTLNSIKRKLLRIRGLLAKWVELYTTSPSIDDESLTLSRLIYEQIENLTTFSKVNKKAGQKDLNDKQIDETSFISNKGNIKKFLRNWSKLRYTSKYKHSIKNFKLSTLADMGLKVLDAVC